MTRRHLLKILSAFLAVFLLSGCSLFDFGIANLAATPGPDNQGETPGTAIQAAYAVDKLFSLNYDPDQPLNPLSSGSALNLMFAPLIYEDLFTVDENFNATPSRLLKSYSTDDGKSWRFMINTDVVMQDGSTLTASDVSYSIRRAMSSALYKTRLADIYGVSPNDDEGMVLMTLKKPNFLFFQRLDIPIIKDGGIDADIPAGTGPYVPNADQTALVLFPQNPNAASMPVDTIYLKSFTSAEDKITAFENSSIDLVVNDPNGLSNLGYGSASVVKYFQTLNMQYLGFNTQKSFFMYSTNRAAITFAIDRDHIVQDLMGGCGAAATLPMSPVSQYYNQNFANYYSYSLDRCLLAFKNAGVEDFDGDGKLEQKITDTPLELNLDFIVNSDSAVKVSAARAIADSLNSIGLPVTLRELSWGDYTKALQSGDFDMYYGEVRLTADFDLSALTAKGGSLNFGGYDDPACDQQIAAYLGASDTDRQMEAEYLCQFFAENAPIIPIAFAKQEVITHRGVVTGLTPTQDNIFYGFQNWKINMNAG
ncbi:MAG: ABC transporter substrate-binding protein [Firmicutes bacterium]|nr:ABC transporter substrate-binding protein [Bacillota bacterium]